MFIEVRPPKLAYAHFRFGQKCDFVDFHSRGIGQLKLPASFFKQIGDVVPIVGGFYGSLLLLGAVRL